jgi:hypothetical protein
MRLIGLLTANLLQMGIRYAAEYKIMKYEKPALSNRVSCIYVCLLPLHCKRKSDIGEENIFRGK